jgi:hypothetical protein
MAGVLRATLAGDTAQMIADGVADADLQALAAREGAQLRIEPLPLEDLFVELA